MVALVNLERIVCFINGDRGVAVLSSLILAGYKVVAVVTTSQKRVELNPQATNNCVFEQLEVSNVNDPDVISELSLLSPSIFIVAGFSHIFGSALLGVPRFGTLNLHAGRLPQYRGGSPLNWQLINGESQAGISVIQADDGIDTGRILAEDWIPIDPETTILELHKKANILFPKLVLEALACIERGESGCPQLEDLASYWHQRSDADGKISFREMTASQVDLMVRALTRPYPGAWCFYHNKLLRIFSVKIPNFVLRGVPGRLCFIQGRGPYVICSDRAVLLTEYKIESATSESLSHGDYLL